MRVGESGGASAVWMLQRLFQTDEAKASSSTEGIAGRQKAPGEKSGPSNACGGAGAALSSGTTSALVSLQTDTTGSLDSAASDAASKLLNALDANGDGEVSADELATAFSTAGITGDASISLAKLDSDGNGSLNADELKTAISSDMATHARGAGGPPPGGPPPGDAPGGSKSGGTSASSSTSAFIDALDTNGDGEVSAAELAAAFSAAGIEGDAAKSVSALDTDGNGTLNADELTAALSTDKPAHARHARESEPHSAEGEADSLIKAFDSNTDGGISLAETATALGRDATDQGLVNAFASLDGNGDGQLSAAELTSAIQTRMADAIKAYSQQALAA